MEIKPKAKFLLMPMLINIGHKAESLPNQGSSQASEEAHTGLWELFLEMQGNILCCRDMGAKISFLTSLLSLPAP